MALTRRGQVTGWSAPFIAAIFVFASARTFGLLWWTAAAYTVAAGILGVVMDVDVLSVDDALAAVGLFAALGIQVIVLVPVAVLAALIVAYARRRIGRRTGGAQRV